MRVRGARSIRDSRRTLVMLLVWSLRDLDLDAAALPVRSGKGRKARRVLLTEQAIRTFRAYLKVRCPAGLPSIGSEALLVRAA